MGLNYKKFCVKGKATMGLNYKKAIIRYGRTEMIIGSLCYNVP